LAALPDDLIETPRRLLGEDVLSNVLRTVRLSGLLQFCFMPSGAWQTDDAPSLARMAKPASHTVPFHVVVEGSCWLKMPGIEATLATGDVVAFPFGTGHQLGAGSGGGRLVTPVADLPPKPWQRIPMLRYGEEPDRVRLLCGYLQCDALNFAPLRQALPQLLHVRTAGTEDSAWLRAAIAQLVVETDRPRNGGQSMLERLTEIIFIELLRHQILAAPAGSTGWLAALADPVLGRCLSLIHEDPGRDWSVTVLCAVSGASRSVLTERFETVLSTSPMRYVRDWRLYLASVALKTTERSISTVAFDAGYGTEAAFNRAFSRCFGVPPAAWRQQNRH
jgi:AraC-like DNA-binding protein